jgi:hypothetical protein
MEVTEHLHTPGTLTPKKEPLLFTEYEVEWAPELVRMFRRKEKSLDPAESCCYCHCLMADLGFIPLVFWHPSTTLTILERYGPIFGTERGELCPLSCSLFCILCSDYD